MVILNDSVLKIDGYLKGLKRNDSEVKNISGVNDCEDDIPFEYLYTLTTTTGTVPFYSLWDGECLVSTGTSFDDAKKNLDKYNKRIKHHDKREKEYTDENGNKYTERKLFKSVMKIPVVDEPPYHTTTLKPLGVNSLEVNIQLFLSSQILLQDLHLIHLLF